MRALLLAAAILSAACGRREGEPPSGAGQPPTPGTTLPDPTPDQPPPPEPSRPEHARWVSVYPPGPDPFVAPAADASHDLFVLVPSPDVPARGPVPLERRAADGSVTWTVQIPHLMSAYLAPDRDGSVLVSSVVDPGWIASVVRVSADGGSQAFAYTAPLATFDGSPGGFGSIKTGGGALALFVSAPTHFRALVHVPPGGAPEVNLGVGEQSDLRAVVDWVVTPEGSCIVDGAASEGATVNGTSLPWEESLILIDSSGSVSVAPVPRSVTGWRLEVGTDGDVLFLGITGAASQKAQLVLGRVEPSGQVVGLRGLAGSERDPLEFLSRKIVLGARGDAAVLDPVATEVGAGECHSRAVIFPASGGAAVTRDLGHGYCIGMVAMTSDGALVVSGRFAHRVRFGPAVEDVAERDQSFVAVVDPGE